VATRYIRHCSLYLFVLDPHGFSVNIDSFELFIIIRPYVNSCSLFLYCLVSSGLEFESTISAGERPKTYALDCAATGTGGIYSSLSEIGSEIRM